MFSSKQEVDRHVRSTFGRIKDEKERKKRSFPVARMYYGVKEYELAKKYLTAFLTENDNYPAAHKLMGQIIEEQGNLGKAVECFKKSLQQDSNQKDVLLKICDLYSRLDIDPERAKYWVERAEKHFPNHDVVFKLREMIYTNGELETNSEDLENLLASQLAKEPKDVKLRMRLLRLYVDTNRVNEAYEHALSVEKKAPHQDSLEWYKCLNEILQVYQEESGRNINGVYHQQLMSVLNNLARLSLEKAKLIDCAEVLFRFDSTLLDCGSQSDSEEWKEYYQEMKAQFLFHAGTLLLKRAQQDQINWREASDMAAACYLVSFSTEPLTTRTSWFSKASPEEKRVLELLKTTANYRASQTGHMLEQLKKGDTNKWLQKIKQQYFSQQGKEKLFDYLFTLRNMKSRKEQSFLVNSNVLLDVSVSFPTREMLREYDQEAHLLYPDSLAGLVWLALQQYNMKSKVQPNYEFQVYESLPFSTQNLKSASAETLCHLDTQAFLYGVVWCAAQQLEERRSVLQLGVERPMLLPSVLSGDLCTAEQSSWWAAAYILCTNSAKEKLAQLRQTLQRGLEVLRLLGNHGMDASILISIAQSFAQQVEEIQAKRRNTEDESPEATALRTRARQYWTEAIDVLQKLTGNKNVSMRSPKIRMFASYDANLTQTEIYKLLDQGRYYLACETMHDKNHEEAIQMFAQLACPFSSYQQAQIYKRLAQAEIGQLPKCDITSEIRGKYIALLIKARDALYLTLDRTRGDKNHKLTLRLPDELDEIESKINKLDPDAGGDENTSIMSLTSARVDTGRDMSLLGCRSLRDDTLGLPTDEPLVASTPYRHGTSFLHHSMEVNLSSANAHYLSMDSSRHLPPSPERLDAQIRSLIVSQEGSMQKLRDDNEELRDELRNQKKLIEALQKELEVYKKKDEQKVPAVSTTPIMPANAASPHVASIIHAQFPGGAAPQIPDPHRHLQYPMGPPPTAVPYYPQYRTEYDYMAAAHQGYSQMYAPSPMYQFGGFPAPGATPQQMSPHQQIFPTPQPNNLMGHGGNEAEELFPDEEEESFVDEGEDVAQMRGRFAGYATGQEQFAFNSPTAQNMLQPGYFAASPRGPGNIPGMYSPPVPQPGYFSSPDRSGMSRFQVAPRPGLVGTPLNLATSRSNVLPGVSGLVGCIPPTSASDKAGVPLQQVSPALSLGGSMANSLYMSSTPAATATSGYNTKFPILVSSGTSSDTQETVLSVTNPVPSTKPTVVSTTQSKTSTIPVITGVKSPGQKPRNDSQGSYEDDATGDEDSYNGPDFEPVVPLPPIVEVKTGEEEETVLFQSRAKLFRFIDNQWKERGLGEIKILYDQNRSQVRVLMRREQTLKVCANHKIKADMEIVHRTECKDNNILTWRAMDFSDKEQKMEQFCCKFKTQDIAENFRVAFEKARKIAAEGTDKVDSSVKESIKSSDGFGLEKFKMSSAQWECSACLVRNSNDKVKCAACGTPNGKSPGVQTATTAGGSTGSKQDSSVTASPAATASYVFGSSKTTTPVTTSTTPVVSTTTSAFAFKASAPQPTGFTFGGASPATTISSTGTPSKPAAPFSFGGSTASVFGFGTTSSSTSSTSTPSATKPFTFGSAPSAAENTGFVFGKPSQGQSQTPASDMLKTLVGQSDKGSTTADSGSAVSGGTSEEKTTFGGFTFKSTPVIQTKTDAAAAEKEKQKKDDSAKLAETGNTEKTTKVNPFASFTFSPPKTNEKAKIDASTKKDSGSTAQMLQQGPVFGSAGTALDFSSLATATPNPKAFGQTKEFKGFRGAGEQLFQTSPGKEAADDSVEGTEFEPDVDFKPLIPLPELIEVKTGEEGEEKLFGERAKLYRYVADTNEWKERGVGEMKILKNKSTGRTRILMRREQVLKLCANHHITKDLKLERLQSSDRSWCWAANDFTDGEVKLEKLAVKFKSHDLALAFKEVFESCQAELDTTVEGASKSSEQPVDTSKPSLAQMFKAKPGQWECSTCLVRNDASADKCLSCETPKPGNETKLTKPVQVPKVEPSIAEKFKMKEGQWECDTCLVRNEALSPKCVSCQCPKPGTQSSDVSSTTTSAVTFGATGGLKMGGFGSSFGNPFNMSGTSSSTNTPPKFDTSTMSFGSTGGGFKFGSGNTISTEKTANQESVTNSKSESAGFSFGSSAAFTFAGVTPVKSPSKGCKSPVSPQSPEFYENSEGEDDHIYFEPIIHLEKVAVKTGEEEETVLYQHRAKLYRFDDGEWKERGIGDVKILQKNGTKKVRLLMRREQIMKVCLNHFITPDMELKAMSNSQGKAWTWHAENASDVGVHHEHLAIRFKTPEIAQEFSKAFEDAKTIGDVTQGNQQKSATAKTTSPVPETKSNTPSSSSKETVKTSSALETFSFKSENSGEQVIAKPKLQFGAGFGTGLGFGGVSKFSFGQQGSDEKSSSPQSPSGTSQSTHQEKSPLLASLLTSDKDGSATESPDDVQIVKEQTADAGQVEKARSMMLPDSFYLYEQKSPCKGCIGCDDHDKDAVVYVRTSEASAEEQADAARLKLPKNFYMYKQMLDCAGCIGCESSNFDFSTIGKNEGSVAKETTTDSAQTPQQATELQSQESYSGAAGDSADVFGRTSVSDFSFAALAAQSETRTVSSFSTNDSRSFKFQGAGSSLFQSPVAHGEDGDDDEVQQGPDPHFEPVVQLPEVEVKTGEEEEEAVWSHRCKLYRFDTNQWKERGIGDIKILKHKETGRFRVLMRRDQVLKLACNHMLTADLSLQPMSTSETSLCWYAMDATEGEPRMEQLAVRFKTQSVAADFKNKFEECQQLLNASCEETSKSNVSASEQKESFHTPDSAAAEQDEDDEEDSDEDEDYEDVEPMFSKRATLSTVNGGNVQKLGMGDLQIVYDEDAFCARIIMENDESEPVCDMVICKEYKCTMKQKSVEWEATNYDEKLEKCYRAQFSSKDAAVEFDKQFKEGVKMAEAGVISKFSIPVTFPEELQLTESTQNGQVAHTDDGS